MQKLTENFIKALVVGPGTTHENMIVYPLTHEAASAPPFLSLDAALVEGLLTVTEVSEAGEVPNLKFINRGERPVLILAGEVVVGAKKNRIVNAIFLVAGQITIEIPVSCVESGRWRYRGKEFQSEKRMSSPQLRTRVEEDVHFSIRQGRGFRANQSSVWDEIGAKSTRMAVDSPTEAMADIYESHEDKLQNYTRNFAMAPDLKGLLVEVNGRITGLEIFGSADSLGHYFDKLIQSYALDALDLSLQGQVPARHRPAVQQWVEEVTV